MLQTLAIHGPREKGKVGTGTFFTTIVKFEQSMPRRRVPTRISDADARLVAGHLMFAAAAEALGGIYGTVGLERALAFTPAARARQQAERRAAEAASALPPTKAKAALPTGTCKKWLEGHVPFERTISLIGDSHPNVAARMQQARGSDLIRALTVAKDDFAFVGRRIASLSPELLGEYLGCMALGHCNPDFASSLSARLLHLAIAKGGSKILAAVIASDRQLPSPRGPVASRNLDQAFRLALDQNAKENAEVAFAKEAITSVWSRRTTQGKRIEARPVVSQMFATQLSKMPKFATNQG